MLQDKLNKLLFNFDESILFYLIETISVFISAGVVWSCRFETDSQTSYHHIL